MHNLRYFGATLAILGSGWSLMAANGLRISLQTQAEGWHLNDLPGHPIALIALYVTVGLSLPFLSAWLTSAASSGRVAGTDQQGGFWNRYLTRVSIAFLAAFLVAGLLAFLAIALLDAGII